MAGFQYAPHGDLEAVEQLIDEHTGGILVEPILGEGGIVPARLDFWRDCDGLPMSETCCWFLTRCKVAAVALGNGLAISILVLFQM